MAPVLHELADKYVGGWDVAGKLALDKYFETLKLAKKA